MVKAIVSAQKEMSRRQDSDNWICAGLRRNGLLAYRADLSAGRLVPVTDEEAGPMGSARLKSSWLKDRYHWVNSDLEPLEPDYSLMSGSKLVADLVEYDYWNPTQADEAAAVEGKPLVPEDGTLLNVDELPVEMQLPCIESGLLRLPLQLQRAAWRKELAGGFEANAKKRSRVAAKKVESLARRTLGDQMRALIRDRLRGMSVGQALKRFVPRASEHLSLKGAKKRHLKLKKKAATKHVLSDLKKSVSKAAADAPPALSADLAAALPGAGKGPLLGKKCRVLQQGSLRGKTGLCTEHNVVTDSVQLTAIGSGNATSLLSEAQVMEHDPSWLKPLKWRPMRLSRELKQRTLAAAGGWRFFLEDEGYAAEPVEEISSPPQMLLDQHLLYGFEMLRWHLSEGSPLLRPALQLPPPSPSTPVVSLCQALTISFGIEVSASSIRSCAPLC
jgi:hypothetical protein